MASATLEVGKLRAFFDRAPVVEVEGRTWPVEIRYRPGNEGEDVPDKVAGAPLGGGIRKMRISRPGRGRSGGARVVFLLFG